MSLELKLFAISLATIFFSSLLFLAFSWITVRKLKNNPVTKDVLGFEFFSGWNIINIAQALSLPKVISQNLKNSKLRFLQANSDLLNEHTNFLPDYSIIYI